MSVNRNDNVFGQLLYTKKHSNMAHDNPINRSGVLRELGMPRRRPSFAWCGVTESVTYYPVLTLQLAISS